MLRSAPSFCIYTSEDGFDGENERENLERSVDIGDRNEEMGSGEFSFGKKGMGLIDENGEGEEEVLNELQDLGVGGGGSGGFIPACFGEGGNVEEYYKRMISVDPSNPLFLKNYAQLLRSKGDLHGAEEYLFQATLADPKDGEICSSYANLVWELHHDQDKAANYFEQAALAAPEDTHVLAAYACFLWEIEEDEENDSARNDQSQSEEDKSLVDVQKTAFKPEKETLHLATGLGIDVAGVGGIDSIDCVAADSCKGGNMEDYYTRMVEENPCNPLFLRNYAQFLYQSKGDLQAAEEYFSHAILADPTDGEIISQYASLVWELHRDHNKALSFFERAIQATPEDSHVLAAYAKFLWETEDDEEEDSAGRNHIQAPAFVGATNSATA